MRGGRRCRLHGGSAPQVKAAAVRNLARERARSLAYLAESDRNALDVLQETRARAAAEVRLTAEEADSEGGDADAYRRSLRDAATIAKLELDADIDQRRLALDQATAQVVVAVLRAAVARAGLDIDAQTVVLKAAGEELRRLEATA